MSTSFITHIHRTLFCELRAVKAPNSAVILARFNRVPALRETPHLWGGKLKPFETPNAKPHTPASQSAYSAAKNSAIVLQHRLHQAAHRHHPIRNGEVRLCRWLGEKELHYIKRATQRPDSIATDHVNPLGSEFRRHQRSLVSCRAAMTLETRSVSDKITPAKRRASHNKPDFLFNGPNTARVGIINATILLRSNLLRLRGRSQDCVSARQQWYDKERSSRTTPLTARALVATSMSLP